MLGLILGFALLAAPQTQPQTQTPPASARPNPCDAPEFRQFDFWLGDWEVKGPGGRVLGHNTIEPIAGNCGLLENWRGALGGSGRSVNTFERADGTWHQAWVGGGGGMIHFSGGFEGGKMVMTGTTRSGNAVTTHRMTWTPLAAGGLQQVWETSTDGGTTWALGFDGTYSRKK